MCLRQQHRSTFHEKIDKTTYQEIHFISQKSEVIEKLITFCYSFENQFENSIKEIHSDGGKEYKNDAVEIFLKSKGI